MQGAANEWKIFCMYYKISAVIIVLRYRDGPPEKSCEGAAMPFNTALIVTIINCTQVNPLTNK